MTVPYHRPVVLVLGGGDPTGGAGIQADIETIFSMACHPAAVVTAVTVQDTKSLKQYSTIESAQRRLRTAVDVARLRARAHHRPTRAHGLDPVSAVNKGLRHGFRAGAGLHLPDRLYWAQTSV